ncbi:uncharacterized protein G2W53_007651 [Senna tora]|uniref:Uncharacterized protein n=1 Tax=Senna tora TaxID=362788 RepID=A0A834X6U2_9FABA|nr:uncharacterized protein G2W53_007651 [Senna tora]
MTGDTFHAIKSSIRASNLVGFRNTMRSDQFQSLLQQHV